MTKEEFREKVVSVINPGESISNLRKVIRRLKKQGITAGEREIIVAIELAIKEDELFFTAHARSFRIYKCKKIYKQM